MAADADVEEDEAAVRAADDVEWLDVPVDDLVLFPEIGDGGGQLASESEGPAGPQ